MDIPKIVDVLDDNVKTHRRRRRRVGGGWGRFWGGHVKEGRWGWGRRRRRRRGRPGFCRRVFPAHHWRLPHAVRIFSHPFCLLSLLCPRPTRKGRRRERRWDGYRRGGRRGWRLPLADPTHGPSCSPLPSSTLRPLRLLPFPAKRRQSSVVPGPPIHSVQFFQRIVEHALVNLTKQTTLLLREIDNRG